MLNKSYPVTDKKIYGLIQDNEEGAWASFDEELKYWLFWFKGFKYWRVLPCLEHHKDFDTAIDKYIVMARITISVKPFNYLLTASTTKPYPTELPKILKFEDGESKYYGFGLAKGSK